MTASATAAAASVSPVVQHAQRLFLEGRLAVSPGQLAELAGGHDETLFGFSVRELSAPDAASRVRAAERLKALGQPAAAPALATALHAEKDPTVQVALLAGLRRGGQGGGGLGGVARCWPRTVPEVRIAALKALLTPRPSGGRAPPRAGHEGPGPLRAPARLAAGARPGGRGRAAAGRGGHPRRGPRGAQPRGAGARGRRRGARPGDAAGGPQGPRAAGAPAAAQSLSRILGQDVSAVVDMDEGQRRREIRRLATLPVHPVRASLAPRPRRPRASRAAPRSTARPPRLPAASRRLSGPQATPCRRPRRAPAASRPASPVEALCASLMSEIRVAIRGRSLAELSRDSPRAPSSPRKRSPCWWPGARWCAGVTSTSPLEAR